MRLEPDLRKNRLRALIPDVYACDDTYWDRQLVTPRDPSWYNCPHQQLLEGIRALNMGNPCITAKPCLRSLRP